MAWLCLKVGGKKRLVTGMLSVEARIHQPVNLDGEVDLVEEMKAALRFSKDRLPMVASRIYQHLGSRELQMVATGKETHFEITYTSSHRI